MFGIFKSASPCLCPYKTMEKLRERPSVKLPDGVDIPPVKMDKLDPVVATAPEQPDFAFLNEQGEVLGKIEAGAKQANLALDKTSGAGGADIDAPMVNISGQPGVGVATSAQDAVNAAAGAANANTALEAAGISPSEISALRVPDAVKNMPVSDMQMGKMSSLPVAVSQVKSATGVNLAAPELDAKARASLESLADGSASLPDLPPPAVDPKLQEFYASVSRLQTCQANTGVNLAYDANAAVKMQKTVDFVVSTMSKLPPFPAVQLAELAKLTQLIQVCEAFNIKITDPKAFVKLKTAIENTSKNIPPARPSRPLPDLPQLPGAPKGEFFAGAQGNLGAPNLGNLQGGGVDLGDKLAAKIPGAGDVNAAANMNLPPNWAGISQNIAVQREALNANAYFKADLSSLNADQFNEKVCLPMQRANAAINNVNVNLTPEQIATCQSYAQARQLAPALKLMRHYDISKLDMAPLADLPEIPDVAPLTLSASLGETTGGINKSSARCAVCKLR
ncbi:MAG: hypothetical protein LBS59_02780 [Puniceicoccales bacterium]|jgi:hypothetical protein|nr:hypothetical protein [Puniceicoccales bacterium]